MLLKTRPKKKNFKILCFCSVGLFFGNDVYSIIFYLEDEATLDLRLKYTEIKHDIV